jgi:6-phosphogluconolactonase/glucosamine-6-phosphate isomerase/deaminase
MRIQVGKDDKAWVEQIWFWVHSQVAPGQRVFVPAGNTPIAAYQRWSETPSELLRSLRFVQIDEVLTGPQRGVFKRFFIDHLAPFAAQFEWIENADRGADVAILGVGANGHVAFHEPQLPLDFHSGCVALSPETLRHLQLSQPTWGVTYGASAFLRCQRVLILARGEQKKAVMKKAIRDKSLPIGWLMEHRDVTLISDFEF